MYRPRVSLPNKRKCDLWKVSFIVIIMIIKKRSQDVHVLALVVQIVYEDGDSEEVEHHELVKIMVPEPKPKTPACASVSGDSFAELRRSDHHDASTASSASTFPETTTGPSEESGLQDDPVIIPDSEPNSAEIVDSPPDVELESSPDSEAASSVGQAETPARALEAATEVPLASTVPMATEEPPALLATGGLAGTRTPRVFAAAPTILTRAFNPAVSAASAVAPEDTQKEPPSDVAPARKISSFPKDRRKQRLAASAQQPVVPTSVVDSTVPPPNEARALSCDSLNGSSSTEKDVAQGIMKF